MEPILTPSEALKLADKGETYRHVMKYTHEVAETAAIITLNLFDEFSTNDGGVMERIGIICTLAEQFVEQHRHVTEWSEFVATEPHNFDCWEDYLIQWVRDKVKQTTN